MMAFGTQIQHGPYIVPTCDRCGADIVNVEVRAENLQGLLPAPGAMAVLEEQSTQEPHRFAQQGHHHGPMRPLTRV